MAMCREDPGSPVDAEIGPAEALRLPRFVRRSANQPMLDPEITCQADNIRPELIRDLQSVVVAEMAQKLAAVRYSRTSLCLRRSTP